MDQRLVRYRSGKKKGLKYLENIFRCSEEKENVLDMLYNRLLCNITNLSLNTYFKEHSDNNYNKKDFIINYFKEEKIV